MLNPPQTLTAFLMLFTQLSLFITIASELIMNYILSYLFIIYTHTHTHVHTLLNSISPTYREIPGTMVGIQ